jgi:sterol desaturase/sphingolipid hydroxylase (fatty acid hydroxylase superfamily)
MIAAYLEPLSLVGMWALARALVPRARPKVGRSEWVRDAGTYLLAFIVTGAVSALLAPRFATPQGFRVGRVLLAILIFDLFLYLLHRGGHTIAWRMHRAHHAPAHFGAEMAFRDSWLHLTVYAVALRGLERVFGLSLLEGAVLSSVFICFQLWTHMLTTVRLGPWDWVFIGPHHHREHHDRPMRARLVNLGGLLCVWDQLLGTYLHPREPMPIPARWSSRRAPDWRDWVGL